MPPVVDPGALFAAIPSPAFAVAPAGTVTAWNGAAERAWGWPAAEVLGRLPPMIAGAARAPFLAAVARVLAGESDGPLDVPCTHRDGAPSLARFQISAVRKGSRAVGAVLLDVGGARPPREKRPAGAESALNALAARAQTAETAFRQFVESTPDLVFFHREGWVMYANPALLAVLGRALEEVVGMDALEWLHPDDRESQIPRLRASGSVPPAEVRLRSPRGEWVHAEFISTSIAIDGAPARVAIGRDVTERKHAQDRLALAERLASAGTLAAGVAHELKNPLTFVLANIEYASSEIRQLRGLPAQADGWDETLCALEDALDGAERMRVIVRDLRTVAREDDATEGPVEIARVVEYAAHLAGKEIRRRARLTWDLADVPPVRGNDARVGQVLVNLLLNAAQAIPEGDASRNEIHVAARAAEGGRVEISVSDTGTGIAPEIRARIFDPFFTTKPVGEGTGIGLWVCHDIVTGLGGTISVESAPGVGTTFHVLLPAAPRAEPRPRPERPRHVQHHVLVVDDEPLVAATIRRHLGVDFVIDTASSAGEALARISRTPDYDAVLSDVSMPCGGGLALLEALRATSPALARRFVFVTGGASPESAARIAAAGVPRLDKPFNGRQLRETLRSVLA